MATGPGAYNPNTEFVGQFPGELRNHIYESVAFRYDADWNDIPSEAQDIDGDHYRLAHGWTLRTLYPDHYYRLWTKFPEIPADDFKYGGLLIGPNSTFGSEFQSYVYAHMHNMPNIWDARVMSHIGGSFDSVDLGLFSNTVMTTFVHIPPTFKTKPDTIRLFLEFTSDGNIADDLLHDRIIGSYKFGVLEAIMEFKYNVEQDYSKEVVGQYRESLVQSYLQHVFESGRIGRLPDPLNWTVKIHVHSGDPRRGVAEAGPIAIPNDEGKFFSNRWAIGTDAFQRYVQEFLRFFWAFDNWYGIYIDGTFVELEDEATIPEEAMPTLYNGYFMYVELSMREHPGVMLLEEYPSGPDRTYVDGGQEWVEAVRN